MTARAAQGCLLSEPGADQRQAVSWAARPREQAPKAERGAGSAAAAPRSGAALIQ
jgi:hypothetical protein